ncbi:hypothetical protein CN326_03865 [Bacillus sp. AFS018417]|uniref:hypothetical protein n=1 Tax=Bacillus sp. AFS018417 TaxID=2033491 RepID=UPI000BF60BE6|nr:hypothetical protein [Bacillus sp. AFS018417]PEZ09172.1 hypothetical protein CN326_03865 [Bacillus sp. AFS018417]
MKEDTTIDDVVLEISRLLKEIATQETHQTIFLVGRGNDGKTAIIEASHHNDFEITKYQGETYWLYVMSKIDPGELIRVTVNRFQRMVCLL